MPTVSSLGGWFMLATSIVLGSLDYIEGARDPTMVLLRLVFILGLAVIWQLERREAHAAVVDQWFVVALVASILSAS